MKVEYIDHMGSDESVVRAARVSFAKDTVDTTSEIPTDIKDAKLIKYLATHNHWTPFAHTAITLRMTAPVPIRTQCFKHKQGFVENEESRRYISCEPEFFFPIFRQACANKKQGSSDTLEGLAKFNAVSVYGEAIERAKAAYIKLLDIGVCEEQARFVLPQGTKVNWYWTGSLAAYARFAKQRMDSHAQLEIQELAHMVDSIIKPLYPVSWAALTGE